MAIRTGIQAVFAKYLSDPTLHDSVEGCFLDQVTQRTDYPFIVLSSLGTSSGGTVVDQLDTEQVQVTVYATTGEEAVEIAVLWTTKLNFLPLDFDPPRSHVLTVFASQSGPTKDNQPESGNGGVDVFTVSRVFRVTYSYPLR